MASAPRDPGGDPPGRRRLLLRWVAQLAAPLRPGARLPRAEPLTSGAPVRPSWWQVRAARLRRHLSGGPGRAGASWTADDDARGADPGGALAPGLVPGDGPARSPDGPTGSVGASPGRAPLVRSRPWPAAQPLARPAAIVPATAPLARTAGGHAGDRSPVVSRGGAATSGPVAPRGRVPGEHPDPRGPRAGDLRGGGSAAPGARTPAGTPGPLPAAHRPGARSATRPSRWATRGTSGSSALSALGTPVTPDRWPDLAEPWADVPARRRADLSPADAAPPAPAGSAAAGTPGGVPSLSPRPPASRGPVVSGRGAAPGRLLGRDPATRAGIATAGGPRSPGRTRADADREAAAVLDPGNLNRSGSGTTSRATAGPRAQDVLRPATGTHARLDRPATPSTSAWGSVAADRAAGRAARPLTSDAAVVPTARPRDVATSRATAEPARRGQGVDRPTARAGTPGTTGAPGITRTGITPGPAPVSRPPLVRTSASASATVPRAATDDLPSPPGRAPSAGRAATRPRRAGDLPVLGERAPATPERAAHPVVPAAPGPVRTDPAERWHRATASAPLEPARPLPESFRALVRSVTGSPRTVTYTSGPATRAALHASGASAATSRGVLHLPEHPHEGAPSTVALVAHELAHLGSAVVRPRFLLRDRAAHVDDDERHALGVGDAAGPGVAGLPVAGAGRGVLEVARRAAAAAVAEALPATAGPVGTDGGEGATAEPVGWGGEPSPGGASESTASRTAPAAPGPVGAPGGQPGAASAPTGATGAPNAAPGTGVLPDMDRVVEALEERLLVELERRGGRWAGVF